MKNLTERLHSKDLEVVKSALEDLRAPTLSEFLTNLKKANLWGVVQKATLCVTINLEKDDVEDIIKCYHNGYIILWAISVYHSLEVDEIATQEHSLIGRIEPKGILLFDVGLEEIPQEICFFTKLDTLNLSFNYLKTLPEWFCNHFTNLKYLGLIQNELESLPENFGNLKELANLWLSNNPLRELPESICDLSELEFLDLESCELEFLPKRLEGLSKVIAIEVANNNLVSFPRQLLRMESLKELDIRNNHFRAKDSPNLDHLKWVGVGQHPDCQFSERARKWKDPDIDQPVEKLPLLKISYPSRYSYYGGVRHVRV